MLKQHSQVLNTFLFIVDIALICLAWNLAYFLYFIWLKYPLVLIPPDYNHYFNATLVVGLLSAIGFLYNKIYISYRIIHYVEEFKKIFITTCIIFSFLIGASFFYRSFSYSRIHALYFFIISIFFILIVRIIIRGFLLVFRSNGKNLRKIIMIGTAKAATKFYYQLLKNPGLGLDLIGYIASAKAHRYLPIPYLGGYSNIPFIIESEKIDQVYIALDLEQQSDLKEIYPLLAELTVDLNILPDMEKTLNIKPEFIDFNGIPILTLRQSPINGWNKITKRFFDLIVSCSAIFLFLPIMLIIAVLIKLTSKGPIFYLQERMGMDGRKFKIFKFRTMQINAEEKTGAIWACKNDQRRTKLGTFLRKTSLDELPQFFNVLKGEMSIVGPRPEREIFIQKFKHNIPNYMLRHKIKSGITGWAQVNGWRGNTSIEKRIEYDIYYLTHWSILFDIKILFLTVIKGFYNSNAY